MHAAVQLAPVVFVSGDARGPAQVEVGVARGNAGRPVAGHRAVRRAPCRSCTTHRRRRWCRWPRRSARPPSHAGRSPACCRRRGSSTFRDGDAVARGDAVGRRRRACGARRAARADAGVGHARSRWPPGSDGTRPCRTCRTRWSRTPRRRWDRRASRRSRTTSPSRTPGCCRRRSSRSSPGTCACRRRKRRRRRRSRSPGRSDTACNRCRPSSRR